MKQLITPQEVITFAIPRSKFDVTKIKDQVIEAAQEEYIRPFLGTSNSGDGFYEKIVKGNDVANLSDDNKTLLNDYIKPALAFFVLHKCLPFIMLDISSLGLQVNNSEFGTSGTDKQRADLASEVLATGNTLLNKAKDFLENTDNSSKYPDYSSGNNVENSISTIGGMILDEDDDRWTIDKGKSVHT